MDDPEPISRETVFNLAYVADHLQNATNDLDEIIRTNPNRAKSGPDWYNYWEHAENSLRILYDMASAFSDMQMQWYMDHPEDQG